MEERDVQIRGYKIRLPLDVLVVASANPEDYTNRGRIITPAEGPLRVADPHALPGDDRARDRDHGAGAGDLSRTDGIEVTVPAFMKEIIAELTHLARRSHDVSQRSGVSVRMSVANYENIVSNATRRAIRLGERQAAPRISDLAGVVASTTGKIEIEGLGEVREDQIVDKLIQGAVAAVFNRYFSVRDFDRLVLAFDNGLTVDASEMMPSLDYVHQLSHLDGVGDAVAQLDVGGNPAAVASAVEFILEGLHLNRRLNKDESPTRDRRAITGRTRLVAAARSDPLRPLDDLRLADSSRSHSHGVPCPSTASARATHVGTARSRSGRSRRKT